MGKEQKGKVESGIAITQSVKTILDLLCEAKAIKDYLYESDDVHTGYKGKNSKQFKCDYICNLEDGESILIHTANSMETTRFKGKQWDTLHYKRLHREIKYALLIMPDELQSKKSDYLNLRKQLLNNEIQSSIDAIYTQTEFIHFLEDRIYGEKRNGKKAAKTGTIFELIFAHVMSDERNFIRWKNDDHTQVCWNYSLFKKVVDSLQLDANSVKSISAEYRIPNLPDFPLSNGEIKKGGRPKTDVILKVTFNDNVTKKYTFSCKNSTKNNVSVLQFDPRYIVDLLEIEPKDRAVSLLEDYLSSGGPQNFEKFSHEESAEMERILSPYATQIEKWVMCGDEREKSTKDQRAEYILVNHIVEGGRSEYTLERIDDYLERMRKQKKKKTYGTIFTWTVTKADENGKKSIQLKAQL